MRQLPNNIEAEQMLLSALMSDNQVYEHICDILHKDHFYLPVHQKLFSYIERLINNSTVANPITLSPLLENDVENSKEYLAQLAVMLVMVSASKDYAKQVYESYLRRKLIYLGEDLIAKAEIVNLENSIVNQIESAEQKLFELATNSDNEQNCVNFNQSLEKVLSTAQQALGRDGHIVGVTTGLYELDKCIGGLHKSDLIILAGRPSMGKTALAVNIGFNAAKAYQEGKKEGAKVLFFSLEMSSEQLAMRILGYESGIPSDRVRRGAINSKDLQHLAGISQKLSSVPFFIDDTPALSISALRSRVRKMKRQENIGLVIVDYLQLLSEGGKNENRVQELSVLTRGLKALAKELDIPVIAASQLSRAVEQREDKHPQLSDLRESGTIEQDADIVVFIYRESYYVARKKPADGSAKMDAWQQEMSSVYGKATLMIAKQRHGPIKNITAHYNEALTKFDNYIDDHLAE